MKPFSFVIDRIKELAAEYPDRTAQCEYFNNNNSPECIYGHVLADLGVTTAEDGIHLVINGVKVCSAFMGAQELPWEKFGVEPPDIEQKQWAAKTQDAQDAGERWGTAVLP